MEEIIKAYVIKDHVVKQVNLFRKYIKLISVVPDYDSDTGLQELKYTIPGIGIETAWIDYLAFRKIMGHKDPDTINITKYKNSFLGGFSKIGQTAEIYLFDIREISEHPITNSFPEAYQVIINNKIEENGEIDFCCSLHDKQIYKDWLRRKEIVCQQYKKFKKYCNGGKI